MLPLTDQDVLIIEEVRKATRLTSTTLIFPVDGVARETAPDGSSV